jgi:SAM-dependent methyltransferase
MRERFRQWRHRVWGFNIYNRAEWVAEQARLLPPGSRVLDVGAGRGQYRSLFAHCTYLTQDFGREPATVGEYTNLDYESDILSIPVESESFDAILCTEVLEHVPEPIPAIAEMARILRKGGRLFLSAPLGSFLHQVPYHYYGGYTPYWFEKFLPQAGLRVDTLTPNQGFFSLFGQETQRYAELLGGPAVRRLGPGKRLLVCVIRACMRPAARLLPLAGYWLDRFGLETMATVGYHVIATKTSQ